MYRAHKHTCQGNCNSPHKFYVSLQRERERNKTERFELENKERERARKNKVREGEKQTKIKRSTRIKVFKQKIHNDRIKHKNKAKAEQN